MRSRLVRLALVVMGGLGLTAMPVEPAKAHTVGAAAFVATVEVTGGIGYPVLTLPPTPAVPNVLPNGTPTTTVEHLIASLPEPPEVPTQDCLPLPPNSLLGAVEDATDEVTDELWNCHFVFDHLRSVDITSTACTGAAANVLKDPLPPVSPPFCGFAGGGTVTGHCGLSGGQVTVTFTDGHNLYILDLHFRGVGSLLVISGHWTNDLGQHGKVYAQAQAAPVPEVGGRSCTNKSQQDFVVSGTAELYSDPMLL